MRGEEGLSVRGEEHGYATEENIYVKDGGCRGEEKRKTTSRFLVSEKSKKSVNFLW
ncbi:MAG: hypothetical protein QW650_05125 [Thermofilum sp.]